MEFVLLKIKIFSLLEDFQVILEYIDVIIIFVLELFKPILNLLMMVG